MSTTAVHPAGTQKSAVTTLSDVHTILAQHIAAQSADFHARLQAAQAARAAAVAAGTAPKPPAIADEKFAESLQNMREHYLTGAGAVEERDVKANPQPGAVKTTLSAHLFKLPAALAYHPVVPLKASVGAAPVQAQPVAAGDKAVEGLLEHLHSECLGVVNGSAQALLSASEQGQRTKVQTAEFTKQMNALRERDKAAARAKLNALYAKAEAIGKQHPHHRAQVLHVTSHGSNLLNGIYAGLAAAGFTVERDVKGAIHAAWPVAKVAQTVGSWAQGAVKSVAEAFAHLF